MSENKKTKRRVVGSVLKSQKNPKEFYIKFRDDLVVKKGDVLRLESKKQQIESLEAAVAANKLSGELSAQIRARIDRIPEFVAFELIKLTRE